MYKPIKITFENRTRWSVSKGRLVEYIAWSAKAPVTSELLGAGMAREFQVMMSPNSISNFVTALVREGRMVRLNRGVFVHVDHAGIFQ